MNEYKNLFSPFKIGSVELKNRLFVPGMGTNLAEHNGEAGEKLIKYYTERAKGGFGLIITECSAISIEGKSLINECGVWGDELIPSYRRLTSSVHEAGASYRPRDRAALYRRYSAGERLADPLPQLPDHAP